MFVPQPKGRVKKPGDNSLYRKVIPVPHAGQPSSRTIRIACYRSRDANNDEPVVTFGIGYADPEKFAKIFFEVTEENWKAVQSAVRAAFDAKRTGLEKPTRAPKRTAV